MANVNVNVDAELISREIAREVQNQIERIEERKAIRDRNNLKETQLKNLIEENTKLWKAYNCLHATIVTVAEGLSEESRLRYSLELAEKRAEGYLKDD